MESLFVFIVLLAILILVGATCGIIALFKIEDLKKEIYRLKQQVFQLSKKSAPQVTENKSSNISSSQQGEPPKSVTSPEAYKAQTSLQQRQEITLDSKESTVEKSTFEKTSEQVAASDISSVNKIAPNNKTQDFIQLLKDNWLIWMGGIALAFGGVFFVNYSLEAGLLSPIMRIALGTLFGVALIAGAEYLHHKNIPFEGFANYIPAVLAGGGFISLFALTLLALMDFNLLSPSVAFIFLAIISTTASWYALRFGPVLAVLGILGAYSVPIWISSGQAQWTLLLSYVAFVSLSATLVANQVKRDWLWFIIWIFHLGWFYLTVASQSTANDHFLAISLFAVFSIWLLIMQPRLGFKFKQLSQSPLAVKALLKQTPDNSLLLTIIALASLFLISENPSLMIASVMIGLITVPLLVAPLRFSAWDSWPFVILGLLVLLLSTQMMPTNYDETFVAFYGVLGVALALGFFVFVYALYFAKLYPKRLSFSILASSTMFCVLAVSYVNNDEQAINHFYLVWLLILLLVAAILIMFAQKSTELMQQFCYWCGANANLTFIFTLLLDKTALTLALVTQVLLMSWLIQRHRIPAPHWPIKLLVAAILLRLTISPWQSEYKNVEIFSIHWSTVIYPVVIALFVVSLRFWQQQPKMQVWLQGALLHLVALFVTTQTSLYFVGRMPDFINLGLYEKILLSMNWLLLGCVYLYRQQFADNMAKIYRIGGSILLVAGGLFQLHLFSQYNPFAENFVNLGSSIMLSWLWIWWGIPLLVSLWLYKNTKLLLDERIKNLTLASAAVLAFLLINGLIRQVWQGENIALSRATFDGELYSYSIVWLIIGALTLVFSHLKQIDKLQKVGVVLLGLVIAKVFLVDMAKLEGLLRAVSFIGLGLCLVALSWIFQWLRKQNQAQENT